MRQSHLIQRLLLFMTQFHEMGRLRDRVAAWLALAKVFHDFADAVNYLLLLFLAHRVQRRSQRVLLEASVALSQVELALELLVGLVKSVVLLVLLQAPELVFEAAETLDWLRELNSTLLGNLDHKFHANQFYQFSSSSKRELPEDGFEHGSLGFGESVASVVLRLYPWCFLYGRIHLLLFQLLEFLVLFGFSIQVNEEFVLLSVRYD